MTSRALLLATIVLCFGCSQHPLETARAQKQESADQWMVREDKLTGQPDDIHFVIKAQNTIDTPEGQVVPGMVIGCGGMGSRAMVSFGRQSIDNGDVKVGFDGATAVAQKWGESGTRHSVIVPDDLENDFLLHLTQAKTVEIEMTPAGGKPQLVRFKLRNIKELMTLENSCKSWLAAAHVSL